MYMCISISGTINNLFSDELCVTINRSNPQQLQNYMYMYISISGTINYLFSDELCVTINRSNPHQLFTLSPQEAHRLVDITESSFCYLSSFCSSIRQNLIQISWIRSDLSIASLHEKTTKRQSNSHPST